MLKQNRIVVTGGPGAGKTTALDLFRRELGEKVVVVPEAATMLFSSGFPRSEDIEARKLSQFAIFQVQHILEEIQRRLYPGRLLLCDRGTVDGAAYWPSTAEDYFKKIGSTLEKELGRYDAVIFFETAAVGGIAIEGGNPNRVENTSQAIAIDRRLREYWSKHSHFVHVPHQVSFLHKITHGVETIKAVISNFH